MTTDQLVAATILKATGEISTAAFGDDDYLKVLQFSNINIDKWQKEADWNSLYDWVDCGTISATDTFDLDDSIRVISQDPDDYVVITRTDGSVVYYQTVPARDLRRYRSGNYCARIGSTLRFNKKFVTSDAEIGGTLTVPAYTYAEHLTKANDTVPVDDPNWLVAQNASDWVQSDITLAQNRQDFLSEANDLMGGMIKNNGAQLNTVAMAPFPTIRDW